MKNINKYLLIIGITMLLFSCSTHIKSHNNRKINTQKFSEPPIIENAIDLVFKAVLGEEINEVGEKIYIVDKSMGKSTTEIAGYNFVENDSLENYTWNKKIYKAVRYLNKKKISELKEYNLEKYLKKIRELTSNEWSWYEIWIPAFSKDRKTAVLEIEFNNSTENKNFYRRFAYILQWKNGKYQKVNYIAIKNIR